MLRMELLVDNTTPKLKYCKRCGQLKTIYDFVLWRGKPINVCYSCKTSDNNTDNLNEYDTDDCLIYDITIFKKCFSCGKIKNINDDFGNYKPNIKESRCRTCKNRYDREYKTSKKEKLKNIIPLQPTSKRCSKCGEVKLIELFGNSCVTGDRKNTQCKICERYMSKKRKENNTLEKKNNDREKYKLLKRETKNKRRAVLEVLDKTTNRLSTFKQCKLCKCNKQLKDFIVDWTCVDGRKNVCRDCTNKADRDRYAKNELKREKNSIKNKKYNKDKKDQRTIYNNKPEVKARNAIKRRKNVARRRKEDPQYYVIETLRTSVRSNFKRYSEKGKVHKSVKYGIDYLAIFNHIGPQPGDGFEMDHIVPCSVFPDLNIPGMIAMLYHPTNIQWLSKEKNLLKWDHIIPDLIKEKHLEWICEYIGINIEDYTGNNYLLNIIKQED